MEFLYRMFKRHRPVKHKWLDDPEDQRGVIGLPQVATSARLVIQPLETARPAASYAGGDPYLPDDVPWPEVNGVPMGFVMQLDCSELPEDLWGGIGPRSGYLSIFMDEKITAPRLIYHEIRGHIRPAPKMPKPHWKAHDERVPSAGIWITEWPTEQRDRNSVSEPEKACFDRIEEMMPLTWGQAVLLLDKLANRSGRMGFRRNRKAAMASLKEAPARPGEDYSLESAKVAQRMQRSASARVLCLLRAALRQPADAQLTDEDRTKMASSLATAITANGSLIDIRPGLDILGYRIVYREFKNQEPQSLGPPLLSFISSYESVWTKTLKDVELRQRILTGNLESCEAAELFVPPEGIPNYDKAELARAKTTIKEDIAALDAFREECAESLSWLKELSKSAMTVKDKLNGDDTRQFLLDTLRAIRTAGAPETEFYRITEIYRICEVDCTPQAVLALDGLNASDWSRIWHQSAAQLAMKDPTLVPAAIREQFMDWLRNKLAFPPHQMGGIPRDALFHYEAWFRPSHYVRESRRQDWLTKGEQTRCGGYKSHTQYDPPFDGENILLLCLFSDFLLDWRWGDGYSLLLAMPRDALEHGRWDQVDFVITN